MTRNNINRISGIASIFLSCAALTLVLAAVITGWEHGLPDEGAAAHLFQLLLAAEIPVLVVFLMTLDKAWFRRAARMGMVGVGTLALALGCVALFHL